MSEAAKLSPAHAHDLAVQIMCKLVHDIGSVYVRVAAEVEQLLLTEPCDTWTLLRSVDMTEAPRGCMGPAFEKVQLVTMIGWTKSEAYIRYTYTWEFADGGKNGCEVNLKYDSATRKWTHR